MARNAQYTIRVIKAGDNKAFFALIDIGNHSSVLTLTNDIENVVAKEIKAAGITPDGVVYKDSEGVWDGWDPVKEDWVYLKNPSSAEEAAEQYLAIQNQ